MAEKKNAMPAEGEALHDPTVHHEDSDVNVRGILIFVVIFIILTAVCYLALWGLFVGLRAHERAKDQPPVSLAPEAGVRRMPPSPRLQPFPESQPAPTGEMILRHPSTATPAADMIRMDAEQRLILETYDWVDQERGLVRIPIAEAKRIVAERGLPVRQEPEPSPVDLDAQPAEVDAGVAAQPAAAGPAGTQPMEAQPIP